MRRPLEGAVESRRVAPTQDALYADLDLELSWSERDLPERERTKHVHRLHPYLGKYIPQLVEELFRRHVRRGGRVLDPFAGSGTTLVQALESGLDSAGVDIAAFNCLLMRVKTEPHNPFVLEREVRDALARFERGEGQAGAPTPYVHAWYAPAARDDLLRFRSLVSEYEHADVLRIILARVGVQHRGRDIAAEGGVLGQSADGVGRVAAQEPGGIADRAALATVLVAPVGLGDGGAGGVECVVGDAPCRAGGAGQNDAEHVPLG